MDRIRACSVAVALVVAAACAPATALAALAPGTPIAVAPGVPSQGRAWELTTSPDPVSAPPWSGISVAADGNAITYGVAGLLPGYPRSEPTFSLVLSRRGAAGWTVTQVPVPITPNTEVLKEYFSPVAYGPDYETSLWRGESSLGVMSLFGRDRNGEYSLLVEGGTLLGASPDLQRAIVSSRGHLLPADAGRTQGGSLYELEGSTLRLLDVAADGSLISNCGSVPGAVSRDAERTYFTTHPGCGELSRAYLAQGDATPIEISASQCTSSCGPEANVSFLGATPSGSSAFLLTEEKLTDDDLDPRADLYRYDAADGNLTLITAGTGGSDLIPAAGDVQASADGSRAYFTAVEEIGPSETGEQGLYVADAGGIRRVISTAQLIYAPQLSASGRYVVLSTSAALVAADTDGQPDVYRYDAVDGSFVRLSAGFAGGNGPFAARIEAAFFAQGGIVLAEPFRVMSEDGSRVFFVTSERLVPEDGNEVDDVYEWADGSLGLISSGRGPRSSGLVGSSADGRTVFFETADTLLPSDRDGGQSDYYAARIGGGFDESQPGEGPCSCAGPPRARLDRAVSTSATGTGRIQLAPLGAAARKHIAASGWIELLAEVPRAGRLAAEARARIGKRSLTIAFTTVRASRPGPLQLKMRLSKAARKRLAAGGDLQVDLRLRLSGLDGTRRTSFELEGRR